MLASSCADLLPDGYKVRHPSAADAHAIAALMTAADEAAGEEATAADIEREWRSLDLAHDVWVVEAPGGELAAYLETAKRGDDRLATDGYVAPAHSGRGLGGHLIDLMEQRFHELLNGAGVVSTATLDSNDAAIEEAFASEYGHVPESFESWRKRRLEAPFTDTALWLTVWDGDEIAATLMCDPQRFEVGWIASVSVREPWRRRGLGLAMLRHAFGEFWRRGQRRVGLGVDAQNPTGAVSLYERAGMRVLFDAVVYEKRLT